MLQDYIILQLYVKGAPWSFLVNKQVKYNVYVFHPVSWNSRLGITNTTFTVCTMLQGAGQVANVQDCDTRNQGLCPDSCLRLALGNKGTYG